ncbi:hypothetical protein C0992_012770 [Termitomyces sp. T32_za158]|nr:hypothetical protein C0992_012770 [Termitomyces sp. T32_za158]
MTLKNDEVKHHHQMAVLYASAPKPPSSHFETSKEEPRVPSIKLPSFSKDRDDYPDVTYWTEKEWTDWMEKQKNSNGSADKVGFLTDEDGIADKNQISQISERAKVLWNELEGNGQAPKSWKKKTNSARNYFYAHMLADFPDFLLADGYWKLERFATIRFPDWRKARKGQSGVLSLVFIVLTV